MNRTIKNALYILLILTLSASTALLAYLHFFAPGDRTLAGEWRMEVDMTGRAAAEAFGWLQDIEGISVSREEVEARMQNLTVQVNLVFQETGRFEGVFYGSVPPESYEACRQAAYEAFAAEFLALLAERLRMAGYGDGMDRENLEALVTETFGMSTLEYLMSRGPALLPSLEELQGRYEGSGVYEARDGILTRQFETGGAGAVKTENYIRKEGSLILSGEAEEDGSGYFGEQYPVLYTLQDNETE